MQRCNSCTGVFTCKNCMTCSTPWWRYMEVLVCLHVKTAWHAACWTGWPIGRKVFLNVKKRLHATTIKNTFGRAAPPWYEVFTLVNYTKIIECLNFEAYMLHHTLILSVDAANRSTCCHGWVLHHTLILSVDAAIQNSTPEAINCIIPRF